MSFSASPTRNIQAGDTPDLNDGQQSIRMSAENIPRGTMCAVVAGIVTISTTGNTTHNARFVPIEGKDNSGGSPGDLEIKGVTSPQKVALATSNQIEVGGFAEQSATPGLIQAVTAGPKVARYLGKEAALLDINASTPFDHSLTPGVVPDEPLLAGEIGWFQLVEIGDIG